MNKLSVALVILTLLASTANCHQHKIVQKSLSGTNVECLRYGPPWDCVARCQTLLTRDWVDSTGMRSAYDRFYQPDPNDQCNLNRMWRCLNSSLSAASPDQVCLRTEKTIQCYLDQYGEVIQNQSRYVAPSRLQETQIFIECGAMLGISPQRVLEVLNKGEFELPEVSCLVRCFLVRSGLYNDESGLALERFYVACGGYDDEFYLNVKLCIANVRAAGACDKCTMAQRLALKCIGNQYPIFEPTTYTDMYSTNTAGRDVNNNYNIIFDFGDTVGQLTAGTGTGNIP
ncbi:general odorant-binding protein 45-like [Armigeres subalbatus]|uniref:general odorant-binding protein 45-like n=1 Tax=Armigeres subalbatus TaxID=124917 RepID=UPI002ED06927